MNVGIKNLRALKDAGFKIYPRRFKNLAAINLDIKGCIDEKLTIDQFGDSRSAIPYTGNRMHTALKEMFNSISDKFLYLQYTNCYKEPDAYTIKVPKLDLDY